MRKTGKRAITKYLIGFIAISFLLMGCEAFLGDSLKSNSNTSTTAPDEEIMYATISGVLTDNTTSNPVIGATVTAYYSNGVQTTTTDSDGWWYLMDIPYRTFDVDKNDDDMTGAEYRLVRVKYTRSNYDVGTATVNLWGHVTSTITRLALKWSSNVIHSNTTTAYPNLATTSYDQEDGVATQSYYLPDNSSNITVNFNMPIDTDWVGTSIFELMDPDGTLAAHSGSWSADYQTFTVNPTSNLTCTNRLRYHRLRLIRRIRTWDDSAETDSYLHFMDSDKYIDFRVLCDAVPSLLATSTPQLAPTEDSAISYSFDSMGVDSLDASGDVADAASGNTDFWATWSHVSGAVKYRLYIANVGVESDDFDTDTNSTQGEDQRTNWFDTGLTPVINEIEATVRVNVTGLYSANYMGDSKLLDGESVRFVATAIDQDGFESPIGSTTPLTITDAKGPSLSTVTVSTPASANSEMNSATVSRSLTLKFNEEMKTTLGDDNVTLTKSGNNISSITETGAWLYSDRTTWIDSDLVVTFALPSTTLSEAVYASTTLLKVASVSTFLVGDIIGIMDGASTPARVNGTIADVNSVDNILTVSAMAPTANYMFASGASVLLVKRAGLTAYRTTTAANAHQGSTTMTVASATNFYVGQSLQIINLDDDGDFDAADNTNVTISAISSTTFTLSAALARDIPTGSLVIDGSDAFAEQAPRAALDYTGTRTEEIIFEASTASTTIRSTGEYADNQSTVILVTAEAGFGVDDFVKIAASSASTTLNGSDNDSDTSLTVASTADFREGDIVIIHGEVISLTVTDDGGSGDNHTLRNGATGWGTNDNFSFSSGQQIFNLDAITLTDAAVTTTLAADVARTTTGATSISLTSTAGLAEGQDLIIYDGVDPADNVTITAIASASAVTVTGLVVDTKQPYLSGAKVTRAVVTDTCNVDAGAASTTIVMCDDQPFAYSDAMTATVNRAYETRTVDNVTSNTVLTLDTTPSAPHSTGASVTLRSFPETRKITAVGTYSLTLDSALVFAHHTGAAVTKAATGEVEFGATEVDTVLVGDVVIIDKDGSATTVLDRVDTTVLSIDTEKARVILSPVTSTTSIITIDGNNASFSFMGDAVKVTGAQDSNGNAQQTGYARYGNLGSATNGVDL
jgi:hypothetical protein